MKNTANFCKEISDAFIRWFWLLVIMGFCTIGLHAAEAPINVARGRPVKADSILSKQENAERAVDGAAGDDSRWLSANTPGPHWLEVDLGDKRTIQAAHIYSGWQGGSAIRSFELQAWTGGKWEPILGTQQTENSRAELALDFISPVTTDKVRLWINDSGISRVAELLLWEAALSSPPLGTGVVGRREIKNGGGPEWLDADTSVKVLVSQYGFNPEHPKVVNYKGEADKFMLKRAGDDVVVHTGALRPVSGDFGNFQQGDFSEFHTPGDYYIQIRNDRSPGTFAIAPQFWDNLQKYSAWYYFGLRRLGEDNVMGNFGDYRLVNWEHGRFRTPQGDKYKYIGRAWGDGNDGRIYPSASLVVAQYCALKETNPFWDRGDWIYSQVRWGLDGALSFLEKDGLLHWMLAAFPEHQDKTYDNLFFSGDEKFLGDCFNEGHTVHEYSTNENHEVVYTSLLIGPAYAVCLFRDKDPEFFDRVESLVKVGYENIRSRYSPYPQKYSLGSWVWLNLLMWKMTGDTVYRDRAVSEADRLLALQQTAEVGDASCKASGWFHKDTQDTKNPWGEKPQQEVELTPWSYQALFKLIEYLPNHPKAAVWKKAVSSYARNYLLAISRENAFGYTPMKVEASDQSTLKRHHGELGYQYFASIGRQFHQVGNAAFMMQAGKLTQDQELIDAAWRQVFWFAGNNPSGIALIHGFGKNICSQQHFQTTLGRAFPGGVNNGAIGDANDNPLFDRYNEYYTYGNLNVLWLSTVIGASRFEQPLELWPKEITETPHTAHPDQHPLASFPIRMKGGFTYKFTAVVRDDPKNAVRWSVDGVPGGNAEKGKISADGSYAAPFVSTETKVTITAVSGKDKSIREQTEVTIMPAPREVKKVKCALVDGKVQLSWDALKGNVAGYSIWRRLPVRDGQAGTIFEMVGATKPDETSYTYPGNKIHYYDDELPVAGMEFLVKAYNLNRDPNFNYGTVPKGVFAASWMKTQQDSPDKIYGFGPPSDVVKVPEKIN